jgi:hypothetical protein
MKLYAQQGFQSGSGERDKIVRGLTADVIHGAILSPKDYGIDRTRGLLNRIEAEFPEADRLFDPQFYASLMAHDPAARMGKLMSEDYPYFQPKRRSQLESESAVTKELEECFRFQASLPVTGIIAPNIVIRQRFNSIESVIAKNFIRKAAESWGSEGDSRPLYVTLAMDAEALQDKGELEEFLADITLLDSPPTGFYVLVNNASSEIRPDLIDPRTLAGWMLVNHSLALNGFTVINGFSDMLTPFLSAAGGAAGATGWFNTQKVFSMDRFAPPPASGGRPPVRRYLSKRLLNSLRFDEVQRLRGRFPQILNGLSSDAYYLEENGSEPNDQIEEVIQAWDAISSYAVGSENVPLEDCLNWVTAAELLYEEINSASAFRLQGRSNNAHLEALRNGVRGFAELAEIDL